MSAALQLVGAQPVAVGPGRPDRWFDVSGFDRRPALAAAETAALAALDPRALQRNRSTGTAVPRRTAEHWRAIERLRAPVDQAAGALHHEDAPRFHRFARHAGAIVLGNCGTLQRAWWGWSVWDWARLIGPDREAFRAAQPRPVDSGVRAFLIALAYLLGDFAEFQHIGAFNRLYLAELVFGPHQVEAAVSQAAEVASGWGYRSHTREDGRHRIPGALAAILLANRSPLLRDLDDTAFARLDRHPTLSNERNHAALYALQRVCGDLDYCHTPVREGRNNAPGLPGVGEPWAGFIENWYQTSTLTPHARAVIRTNLAKVGRWLAAEHPEATDPAAWTRSVCAAWIAAVNRMNIGDFVARTDHLHERLGQPIAPRTKAHLLVCLRIFFHDLQEWEWVPRRFDPGRALALPRSIAALIGTDPRVIAEDVWAKLLWAGLNLTLDDIPDHGGYYPLPLLRALALTWLFAGLRSDEIIRLRVGCIRWQHQGRPIPGASPEITADEAVCLLEVPVNKTNTAFTKPVDPILGQAIEAWQAQRPDQPQRLDAKTNEHVAFLFSLRAHPVARDYLNRALIPKLCAKAGLPTSDVRGRITSHRARSTIATQLYNAKEPMTLFELQAWLGHRSPVTTQHYAKITPNTLTKAYTEAGYFGRNMRTIEVLVDRDAVASGDATDGTPWQHYDLGHGWCSYNFFEQCPHRMACAKCDFYTPKNSTKAQILEAKDNLQRMLAAIPLTEDEQAAVEDGQDALGRLLERLADTPTPAGPTPQQIQQGYQLPIIAVQHTRNTKAQVPDST